MSRSFKKTPCFKDQNTFAKQQANVTVRRRPLENVQSGGWYKKLSERWDICDWKTMFWHGHHRWRWGCRELTQQELVRARMK